LTIDHNRPGDDVGEPVADPASLDMSSSVAASPSPRVILHE
jgi:hypothetical protein